MIKKISVPVSALTLLIAGSLSTANAQSVPVPPDVNTSISAADMAAWAAQQPVNNDPPVEQPAIIDADCGSDHTHTVDCDGSISHMHTSIRPRKDGDGSEISTMARKFDV
jgi:hypothetical protein